MRTRVVELDRSPVVMWPTLNVFSLPDQYDIRKARETSEKARKAFQKAGLIGLDENIAIVPSNLMWNVNVSKQRGKVKSVMVVASNFDLKDTDKMAEMVRANAFNEVRGDRFWSKGSEIMETATPAIPLRSRVAMSSEGQLMYDLAVASNMMKETPQRHPQRLAETAKRFGGQVIGHRSQYGLDQRVSSYMARFDVGDLINPRSFAMIGMGTKVGFGLLYPKVEE